MTTRSNLDEMATITLVLKMHLDYKHFLLESVKRKYGSLATLLPNSSPVLRHMQYLISFTDTRDIYNYQ